MSKLLALYRTPASVRRDFGSNNISVWWFSRRNATRLHGITYRTLKKVAREEGVSRVIISRKMPRLETSQIPEDLLRACVKERLIMPGSVLDTRKLPAIKSDINIVDYHNAAGQKIRAIVDFPEGVADPAQASWVIIPPAFGTRKETYFFLALYLKQNGFGVLRYDDVCNVGESDGEIKDLTLSQAAGNIIAGLDYITETIGAGNIGVVPFSLAARPAIKAATLDARVKFLLPIVGSPNIRSLLRRVYGEDLVADFLEGKEKGTMQILGHFVDSHNFLTDAVREGFVDLKSTQEDVAKLKIPIIWYCAGEDPWVDPEEVKAVIGKNSSSIARQVKVIPGLTHRFREAGLAIKTFTQVVRDVALLAEGRELREISRRPLLVMRNRGAAERARIKPIISEEKKQELWTNYLEGFSILKQSPDYMRYLADLAKRLDLQPGERLLDAGCGNGYVIEYLLAKMLDDMLKSKNGRVEPRERGEIVGVDFVPEALRKANTIALRVSRRKQGLPRVDFREINLEERSLPHEDWYFDKVVASLFLPYLSDQERAVRELCRVLKPDGTIVLSSPKPDADFSQIFASFIDGVEVQHSEENNQADCLQKGRDFFHQAENFIVGKEEEGVFNFLSEDRLRALLEDNGIVDVKIRLSFGNMVVMAVGKKSA